jgi:AraC-like DNA-binding protein
MAISNQPETFGAINVGSLIPVTDTRQNEMLLNCPFFFRRQQTQEAINSPFHSHNGYEIIYILSGAGSIVIRDKIFPIEPHRLYLINILELHKIMTFVSSEVPYSRIVVNFMPEFLTTNAFGGASELFAPFRRPPEVRSILVPEACREPLTRAWLLLEERSQSAEKPVGIRIALLNVLYEICSLAERSYPEHYVQSAKTLPEQHVEKIIRYIENHYDETITIGKLADELFLSKYYISRIFHQVTGQTIQHFILLKRINEARRLLLQTDLNVLQIAHQVGFSSQTYFSNAFKTFNGVPPLEFRKRMRSGEGAP